MTDVDEPLQVPAAEAQPPRVYVCMHCRMASNLESFQTRHFCSALAPDIRCYVGGVEQ